jgi:broad specificity phosphatase PhoE
MGLEQAKQAGRTLAAMGVRPDLVACSDLVRAQRTAELLADATGFGEPLTVVPELREQDLGDWNGLTNAEIEARWPTALDQREAGHLDHIPGSEPEPEFIERSVGALYRLAGDADAAGVREAVVVTHGGVVLALEKALGKWGLGNRHPNLGGWWAETAGTSPDLQLVLVERADLLAVGVDAGWGRC